MELEIQSDLDVLNDLLHDADGQEEEGDEEAFFDPDESDADQDDGDLGEMTADNILSQLDAVTNLDDDEMQGENADEFHDSTSAPSSPHTESAAERETQEILPASNTSEKANEGGNEPALQETAQLKQPHDFSGEDVVQAVLNLAMSPCDEDISQERTSDSAAKSTSGDENRETIGPVQSETESNAHIELPDANVTTYPGTNEIAEQQDIEDSIGVPVQGIATSLDNEIIDGGEVAPEQSAVLPPPAPVMIGTMNPVEDDSDDDSDISEGGEEAESTPLPPPLRLHEEDDDDDVLEVDAAVVSSLQIEETQRMSNRTLTLEQPAFPTKAGDNSTREPGNPLLTVLPNTKVDSAIDLSLGEEVRVAHVTTLEPNGDFSDLHKLAGGTGVKVDGTFGISYQSMRKKNDGSQNADDFADEGGYTLPSRPIFPDEREFENELELSSDLAFSVATATSTDLGVEGEGVAASAEDDEFAFDIQDISKFNAVSDEILKSRRESFEAQKLKEEEKLVNELKRATDEEKRLLVSNIVSEASSLGSIREANGPVAEADALSLTELHSIYKRGLGDQEVLMDDDEKEATTNSEGDQAASVGRSMSVMGRILSKPYGTETIQEEEDDSETEGNAGKDNQVNETVSMSADYSDGTNKYPAESGEIDKPSEWREITLVQHSCPQNIEESGSNPTVKRQNSPEAMSCITYAEAAGYYAETPDVMQHKNMIVPEDFPRGSCLGCLSRPRLVFDGSIEERDRVFCIAATAFDAHNNVIVAVLETVYKKIMKKPHDVSLIGRHWEDIGFQGTDPSTDLRGCGVLSLLQMLCLVDTHPDLAHRFHTLSQHPTRHFPFACVLINITLQCVVALRSGALYPECNKHSSVLFGMNRLYLALTLHLHDAIQSRTDEIPLIMRDVLDRGRANPGKTINEAFDGPTLRPIRSALSTAVPTKVGGDRKESDNLQFTEIGLRSVDDS